MDCRIGGSKQQLIQISCTRTQYDEGLSECRRLKNGASMSGLGVPEAFKSLFWIKQESKFPE